MTQLLESADRADERVRRVLELLQDLVPYEQCAMLEARLGYDPHIVLLPEPSPEDRVNLTRALLDTFGQLVDPDARTARRPAAGRGGAPRRAARGARRGDRHLAGAVVGDGYSEDHLRALSVIAAKLAAYITIRGASAELAELARERDEARRAVEAAHDAKDELLELVSSELRTPLPLARATTAASRSRTRSRRRPSGSTSCWARHASRPRSCA